MIEVTNKKQIRLLLCNLEFYASELYFIFLLCRLVCSF